MIKKIMISILALILIITTIPIINKSNAVAKEDGPYVFNELCVNLYDKDGYNLSTNDYKSLDVGYVGINNSSYNFINSGNNSSITNLTISNPAIISNFSFQMTDSNNAQKNYGFEGNNIAVQRNSYDNFSGGSSQNDAIYTIRSLIAEGAATNMVYRIWGVDFSRRTDKFAGMIIIDAFLDTTDVSIAAKNQYRNDTPEYEEVLNTINSNINNIGVIKASVKSDTKLGNKFCLVSGKNSATASITAGELRSALSGNNPSVTSITNSNGTYLGTNVLIGTGTKIKLSNNMEFTIVVYGDSTGDGAINALDMKDGIDSFLGTAELTDIQNESLDLKKDGEINALDLSQMVKSYLGTLNGDILQES